MAIIDTITELAMPMQIVDDSSQYQEPALHLAKLLTASEEEVRVTSDQFTLSVTYRQVAELIKDLSRDAYWATQGEDYRTDTKPVRGAQNAASTSGCRPKEKIVTGSPKLPRLRQPQPSPAGGAETHATPRLRRQKALSKYESSTTETSTSDDSSGDSTSPLDSSDSSSPRPPQRQRRNYSTHHFEAYDKRKGVVPLRFVMDGGQSLKSYLRQFEKYFRQTYKGDEYEKSLQLSRFLTGELLDAFTALGGYTAKYFKVIKPQLLRYYKNKRLDSRESWRSKLAEATMRKGETTEVFGLRLSSLANRAFPDDRAERERQLRRSFLKGIPGSLSTQILNTERINKSITGKKRLRFGAMTELAQDLATDLKQDRRVIWTASGEPATTERPPPERGFVMLGPPSPPATRKQINQPGKPKPAVGARKEGSPCGHCHKNNHTKDECWRYHGRCLVCGGDHQMRRCKYYNPTYPAKETGWPDERPGNGLPSFRAARAEDH